ncbi:toprim domain-containing protein [uncultured Bacteroides sp.]|uniref:toprim domain-containing protein n=1 Tax=uncultured Bacteroides sp. TaxID=162156 RepID=UPI0025CEC3B5|nr:toprim domain-containing protein [uncultured Bacteroides sp.]
MSNQLSSQEKEHLIQELIRETGGKIDGSGKNIIADCPFCKKRSKYGIFVGRETERKKLFMSHCFSCGRSTNSLEQLLELWNRMDLMVTQTAELNQQLKENILFPLDTEEEIDDTLGIVELPDFYRRAFSHPYLKKRGFVFDDYEYFPVGTTNRLNFRFDDYVIFPVIDEGDTVGYVSRHTWSKEEIDRHNSRAKISGDYKILRFRNSTENEFVKLLYNYDAIIPEVTDTVILTEGIFDVVALTRKLDLYDNEQIKPVATFGKKISLAQIYKLQVKGVTTVVIGYDGDAVDAIKKTATDLQPYFDVLIADIPGGDKDWEDLTPHEIYEVFAYRLKTPIEYKISKIQE